VIAGCGGERERRAEGASALPRSKSTTRTAGLDVNDIAAPLEVRRHSGARRLTLRVSKTRRAVVLTLPQTCRIEEARRFLKSHLDWIRERLGRVPSPVPFVDGAAIPLRGRLHRIRFVGAGCHGGVVAIANHPAMPRLNVSGRAEHAPRRLSDWLWSQAHQDLDRCVSVHACTLGVRPRRIGLRDQSSRWGSCSSSGVLSFSWRLILAPPHVLDYVAAHEVAHLVEMNHGARFWKLVARCVPDADTAKRWLRSEGSELHRYGVEFL
jgi:predicted metal-dependent hydrolase